MGCFKRHHLYMYMLNIIERIRLIDCKYHCKTIRRYMAEIQRKTLNKSINKLLSIIASNV